MEISGKVSQYINVGALVASGLAALSPSLFPSYIPAGEVSDILKTVGLIGSVLSIMNVALHAAGGKGVSE